MGVYCESLEERRGFRMSDRKNTAGLLSLGNVSLAYRRSGIPFLFANRKPKPIVCDVSFRVDVGETFALVGESGSGKTTIARCIAGLLPPFEGMITFEGRDIANRVDQRPTELKRKIQYVFQNPDASLNPRRSVRYSVARPLDLFFSLSEPEKERRVKKALLDVGLDADFLHRSPTQLSGGERQRVAIARALAVEPELMLCDEVVSALDVSVQANTLDLLRKLQEQRQIAYLFIAHDLAVVRWLADRVGVLYLGRLLEVGTAEEVFSPPFHPYTEMLLQSVPEPDPGQPFAPPEEPELLFTQGEVAATCPFLPRCPVEQDVCLEVLPQWTEMSQTHTIRCHRFFR